MDSSSNDSLMILDIDEVLKDDSFICFFEEKAHDDISNIIQQWKTNNTLPASYASKLDDSQSDSHQQQQHQPQQEQHVQLAQNHMQHNQANANGNGIVNENENGNGNGAIAGDEQAFKLNTKTFTRPRRKSTQQQDQPALNAGTHNSAGFYQHAQQRNKQLQNAGQGINMQIGGLVTTMQKSFLQDTSPPASICSSMESSSIDRMNNSLITSADFSNINFLQSTTSLGEKAATFDGYTFEDMISDRKALESLTMSGDATLIKDSQIAQIDDISMTFSKTTSACSTMNNSTESMDGNDMGLNCLMHERLSERPRIITAAYAGHERALRKQKLLQQSMEMISDTTFNLIENSMTKSSSPAALDVTHNVNVDGVADEVTAEIMKMNETFKKPLPLNETVCFVGNKANATYDALPASTSIDERCDTPEGLKNTTAKFLESTPLQAANAGRAGYADGDSGGGGDNNRHRHQPCTPLMRLTHDMTLSPIASSHTTGEAIATPIAHLRWSGVQQQRLDQTFDQQDNKHLVDQTFPTEPDRVLFITEDAAGDADAGLDTEKGKVGRPNVEMEKCDVSGKTYRKQFSDFEHRPDIEMENVMNLAEAEARLLVVNDDEHEFELMLDEFSKVELNPVQAKMKKSLETIKKRFTTSPIQTEQMRANTSSSSASSPSHHQHQHNHRSESNQFRRLSQPKRSELGEPLPLERQPDMYSESHESALITSRDSTLSNSGSGERLLNRRSRLYDNVNLASMRQKISNASYGIGNSQANDELDEYILNEMPDRLAATANWNEYNDKTEQGSNEMNGASNPGAGNDSEQQYRLAEKRQRDRDRFKTIKIDKQQQQVSDGDGGRNGNDARPIELNVPCIDSLGVEMAAPQIDLESLAIDIKDDDDNDSQFSGTQLPTQTSNNADNNNADNINTHQHNYNQNNNNYNNYNYNNNKQDKEQQQDFAGEATVEEAATSTAGTSKSYKNYLTYRKPNRPTNLDLPEIMPLSSVEEPAAAVVGIESNDAAEWTNTNAHASPQLAHKNPAQAQQKLPAGASHQQQQQQQQQPHPTAKRYYESNLIRPRYISGLPRLNHSYKAQSADGLEQTTSMDYDQHSSRDKLNRSHAHDIGATINSNRSEKVQSPMGIKSKSFHNLAINVEQHVAEKIDSSAAAGQKKWTVAGKATAVMPLTKEKSQANARLSRMTQPATSLTTTTASTTGAHERIGDDATFKAPMSKLVSGIRTGGGTAKRSGLQRPSSGYFSLHPSKTTGQTHNDATVNNNLHRQSMVESLTSSLTNIVSANVAAATCIGVGNERADDECSTHELKISKTFTKITPGTTTGIPKPSGLKPPTNFKRSALPRPSNIAKR